MLSSKVHVPLGLGDFTRVLCEGGMKGYLLASLVSLSFGFWFMRRRWRLWVLSFSGPRGEWGALLPLQLLLLSPGQLSQVRRESTLFHSIGVSAFLPGSPQRPLLAELVYRPCLLQDRRSLTVFCFFSCPVLLVRLLVHHLTWKLWTIRSWIISELLKKSMRMQNIFKN